MYSSVSLPSQRADLTGSLLTMSSKRRSVVDFTVPVRFSSVLPLFLKKLGDGNIRSVEGLLKLPKVWFYIFHGTTLEAYFKHAEDQLAKKIWENNQVRDVTLSSPWRVNEVNCGQYRKDVMGYRLRNACKRNLLREYS